MQQLSVQVHGGMRLSVIVDQHTQFRRIRACIFIGVRYVCKETDGVPLMQLVSGVCYLDFHLAGEYRDIFLCSLQMGLGSQLTVRLDDDTVALKELLLIERKGGIV